MAVPRALKWAVALMGVLGLGVLVLLFTNGFLDGSAVATNGPTGPASSDADPGQASTPTVPPTDGHTEPPDPSTYNLDSQLPNFHEELDRIIVPRTDSPDAAMVLSGVRSGEPRNLTVSLFEWDRGAYNLADQADLDCEYLHGPIEVGFGPTLYVPCTGGASARWLHVVQPGDLVLRVHPDLQFDDTARYSGWDMTGYQRVPVAGRPDDLDMLFNTCIPSCAEGGIVEFRLQFDRRSSSWQAVSCMLPNMVEVEITPPVPVRYMGHIPDVDVC